MSTAMLIFGDVTEPFFCGTGPTFPSYDLISMDDEQVKGVMLKFGHTDLFTDTTMPPHPSGDASIRAHFASDHPTHFLIFVRWENARKSRDNGYAMYGYWKGKCDRTKFNGHCQAFINRTCRGAIRVENLDGKVPRKN